MADNESSFLSRTFGFLRKLILNPVRFILFVALWPFVIMFDEFP